MGDFGLVTAGVLDRSGDLFLLLENDMCTDDELVLSHARRVGDELVLAPLSEPEEFVSLVALPAGWESFVASLGADGEVTLADKTTSQKSRLTGKKRQSSTKHLGRMTTLKLAGETLFAMGYGGQVYLRTAAATWSSMHVSATPPEVKSAVCLYAVAQLGSKKVLHFGGTEIRKFNRTAEMAAAGKAQDSATLAQLILKSKRKNRMKILRHDRDWSDVKFEFDGLVSEFLPSPLGGWYVFGGKAQLWHTDDFAEFTQIDILTPSEPFFDMKVAGNNVLVLMGQTLYRLAGQSLEPFGPTLSTFGHDYINLTTFGEKVALIYSGGAVVLENNEWIDLRIPTKSRA